MQSGKRSPGHRRALTFLFILLFLLFIGVMDYPFVARIYNDRVQGSVVTRYEALTGQMEDEKINELRESAKRYNERLAGAAVSLGDAFLSAGSGSREYEALLDTGEEGIMAVIEIPKIDVMLPVYHGTSGEVLQKGAGHLEGSSLPIGGEDTHTCISAHRGLPSKKMFTNLDQMTEGDIFYLHVLGEILAYEVYETETVTPDQTDPLMIRRGEDLATLITCTPYGINTHRMYIHGRRIPYSEAAERLIQGEQKNIGLLLKNFWWIPVTIICLLWMCILLYRFNKSDR